MRGPGAVLLRADAGPEIGTGHLTRCLALGQALRDDRLEVALLASGAPPVLAAAFEAEGIALHATDAPADAGTTARLAAEIGAAWVVLDGYAFDHAYRREAGGSGARVLALDDSGFPGPAGCALLLNPNLGATATRYPGLETGTRALLGGAYALLRREFRASEPPPPAPARVTRLLVTMGGSDPREGSELALEALAAIGDPELEVRLLVGAGNPRGDTLRLLADRLPGSCELVTAGPAEVPGHMRWAHAALAAAGSTAWELAALGVPALLVQAAPNQASVLAPLVERGGAKRLGVLGELTPDAAATALREFLEDAAARDGLARVARRLVDGKGALRVALALRQADLRLRPAGPEDCDRIHAWASDPETRAVSFSPDPIPLEDHRRWYAASLESPTRRILVAEDPGGPPLGMVRFDLEEAEAEAEIGINLAPEARGRGLGPALLDLAAREFHREHPGLRILARIKRDNTRSLRAFERADFVRSHEADVAGSPAWYCYRGSPGESGGAT